MDASEVVALIKAGENERIEFKKSVNRDIAREICGLANAEGGYILVGVADSGEIVGCDVKRSKEVVTSSLQGITPPIAVSMHVVELGEKEILVIKVPKSRTLCSIGGVAYIRIGSASGPSQSRRYSCCPRNLGPLHGMSSLWREWML
ncbi:AlbA family DNA-binding domain-containing protein [Palaeococcus ferrophilus]|uniref:AlbA family DNA-binding domain-containing protein n=1 Tax=Palaeococcus ferrophilus TaxID=83868 RepID=UPI001FDF4E3F|nr:ATP-binding protein [Palaeococcus ferrophilus]